MLHKKWRFEWFPVMLLYQTSNFREDLGLFLWVLRHQGGPTHPAKMVCGESWSQYLHTWKHSSVDLFLDLISNRFPHWASRLGPREVASNPWKHGPSENECYSVFFLGFDSVTFHSFGGKLAKPKKSCILKDKQAKDLFVRLRKEDWRVGMCKELYYSHVPMKYPSYPFVGSFNTQHSKFLKT